MSCSPQPAGGTSGCCDVQGTVTWWMMVLKVVLALWGVFTKPDSVFLPDSATLVLAM